MTGLRSIVVLLVLGIGWSSAGAAEAEATLEAGLVNPGYHEKPTWFKQSFLDIREDAAEAEEEGRRVVLYFYQDGCPYCKKLLETNFSLKPIVDKTRRHFDVVAINMWGDREVTDFQGDLTTEKQFAADLRVMFTPTMLFLDEQGEVLVRVNGYYAPYKFETVLDYVSGRKEAEMSFRDYVKQTNPAPAKGTLHREAGYVAAPYRLGELSDDKPLLVLFEQKDCSTCDELHLDIFQRPETREQLARFHIALLDMWSADPVQTPQGHATTAVQWARELNVQYAPALVMFDRGGDEAFRAEGYLKSFHVQSVLDYVASGAYREQPNFQRFIQQRAADLEAEGVHVDLMK